MIILIKVHRLSSLLYVMDLMVGIGQKSYGSPKFRVHLAQPSLMAGWLAGRLTD